MQRCSMSLDWGLGVCLSRQQMCSHRKRLQATAGRQRLTGILARLRPHFAHALMSTSLALQGLCEAQKRLHNLPFEQPGTLLRAPPCVLQ